MSNRFKVEDLSRRTLKVFVVVDTTSNTVIDPVHRSRADAQKVVDAMNTDTELLLWTEYASDHYVLERGHLTAVLAAVGEDDHWVLSLSAKSRHENWYLKGVYDIDLAKRMAEKIYIPEFDPR